MSNSQDVKLVEVTDEALDINRYVELVADPGAGAISTFSGVTRNNFQGKVVVKLEYEAYTPMALRKLQASNDCDCDVALRAKLRGLTSGSGVRRSLLSRFTRNGMSVRWQ